MIGSFVYVDDLAGDQFDVLIKGEDEEGKSVRGDGVMPVEELQPMLEDELQIGWYKIEDDTAVFIGEMLEDELPDG